MPINDKTIDTIIRIGLLAAIAIWSIAIIAPFIGILLWAVIVAVSAYPVFRWISGKLGDRDVIAAILTVTIVLLLIVGPIGASLPGLADSVRTVATDLRDGTIAIPEASEAVREWPLIGERFYSLWREAHGGITEVLTRFQPQIKSAGLVVVDSVAGITLAVLQFILSVLIAGAILANHERVLALTNRLVDRIAPGSQERFMNLTGGTVRGVTTGVIGVAMVQAILAGIGFAVIGIPAAALWAMFCFLLAIVQISIVIIVIPISIYVFANYELLSFVLFVAWMIPVGALDNVLKPILMGRGVDAPMLVVFIGAIGGLISFGFLGLFFGAVVLVIANDLLVSWLEETESVELQQPKASQ
jgi:predicted PurR-regulated permease PerM